MTEQEMNTLVEKVSNVADAQEKREADLQKREADIQAREMEVRKAEAALSGNNPNNVRGESTMDYREIEQAMLEKRAITLNGAGSVSFVSKLFEAAMQKSKVVGKVNVQYGATSNTVIPVLAPLPAVTTAAEGATNLASDTTASQGAKNIQPKAYFSELPVSYEALKMGAANLEAALPKVFRKVFVAALDRDIIAGSTSGPTKGIFAMVPNANKIACGAAGLPKIADVVNLAEQLNDMDLDDPVIIMSSTVHAALLAETGSVYDFVKEELARNNKVLGCEVIVTGKAPSTTTAGSLVVWGGSLDNYAVGVAADLTIEPIRKTGDTNTYFQAIMAMGGTPVVDGNMWALKTV